MQALGATPRSLRAVFALLVGWIALFLCSISVADPGVTLPFEAEQDYLRYASSDGPAEEADEEEEDDDLLDLELGDLRKTSVAPAFDEVVTSVNRTESTVGRSPAAVFVITSEMIRRSGARSIPEALRMAPGVHVGKSSSNTWSVSIRGFAGVLSNKLLVQVDGRSVYNNGFSGVYWDAVDVVLDNIERIEVIRGPGASIWGANAVNGIINIITKDSTKTQGVYLNAGGGSEELGYTEGRLGGRSASGDVTWQAWGKWFERDAGIRDGLLVGDDWRQARGGVRFDWTPNCCDTITLEASGFGGTNGYRLDRIALGTLIQDERAQGAFVRGRWNRDLGDRGAITGQVYYDQARRFDLFVDQKYDTLDIDVQHAVDVNRRHSLVYGLRYRVIEDRFQSVTTPPILEFADPSRTLDMISCFLQDEVTLLEDALYFTVGTKLEHNDLTHVEVQPTARLLGILDEKRVAWAAVSRAVRTPSTLERFGNGLTERSGFVLPALGNPSFDSEVLIAYEVGYRAQPVENFSWDITGFIYDYDRLSEPVLVAGPAIVFAVNSSEALTYGTEVSADLTLTPDWRLRAFYGFVKSDLEGSPVLNRSDRLSPHIAYLQSSWDLYCNWDLDAILRYSDGVQNSATLVPSYLTMDLRLAWRPNRNLEFSLVGQNLLDAEQLESSDFNYTTPTENQRGVYAQMTIKR